METNLYNFVSQNKVGVLLLTAPTGSGKTTGIFKMSKKFPTLFGNTWIVQPTKVANSSLDGSGFTPLQVIDRFLKTKHFWCDTLILDEVHTRSVEYETLLYFASIKRFMLRIILLTATPCVDRMKTFFPELVHINLPMSSPFPIDIEYLPCFGFGFPSLFCIQKEVEKIIRLHQDHKRILVFLYTHEQCDRLAKNLEKAFPRYKCKALYGGMEPEDWITFRSFMKKEEIFILLATNVAETSLTIPDITLIVDLGIQCIYEKNRIVYTHCSKSSMIQRAGRTGRTCRGKVIRTMEESDFNLRPFERDPEFSWDKMFLRLLAHDFPSHFYPKNMDREACFRRSKILGILKKEVPDPNMIRFILESPLMVQHSAILFHFLKKETNERHIFVFTMVLALMDVYITRNLKLTFIPPEMNFNRQRMVQKWKYMFSPTLADELHLLLNIFASCSLSSNPLFFAKRCFLNFKSIRIIGNHIHRAFTFVLRHIKRYENIEWKLVLNSECDRVTRNNLFFELHVPENRKRLELFYYFRSMDFIQEILYSQQSILQLFSTNDLLYKPFFFPNFNTCMMTPTNLPNMPILILGQDPDFKMQEPDVDENSYLQFNLFTLPPSRIRNFYITLPIKLLDALYEYKKILRLKEEHKTRMREIQAEIYYDISFRPNKWGVERHIDRLYGKWLQLLNS